MRRAVPPRPRRLSPLQSFFYITQTSYRRFNVWIEDVMPGLPSPQLTEDEIKQLEKDELVDLWTLTLADHRRIFRQTWKEYLATNNPDYASKEDIQEKLHQQTEKINQHLTQHHPELKKEIDTWKDQVQEKLDVVQTHTKQHVAEMKTQAKAIDVEKIPQHISEAVQDLKKKPLGNVRNELEAWIIDKLVVGRETVLAFVQGYRSGKEEELHRETPLLKTLADQAAEKHKDKIDAGKAQFQRMVQNYEAKHKQD
ncbi:hypothetical protein THRCLA_23442 [Thraustotheca clavata]|uniref:Uncharacterized protein n=1 Tax=Thraustotheca clavata TaxID=74557 RepID=A0A1V9Y4R5_9STRA|nr:hypothetical protein THRCLA_23442 [Thraustotheca clavata]